ncbi:L-threonylcarbamoyladenylate synthase [Granulicella sibirica]|uniref:Threonylcarbamoyl-AMP synthase n=1 Tax=Granulicella sibirica TaxID=2479048 RepID=A0A4Q0T4D8_9BACT|nr:L-threonylcarbamoyladenylate synthase [Granulicella sibirica]RXH56859.1 TsaC protein (YrdC domain) required for threonylcarbamoyladenosine t(6)A37 modification in tRNA [Granulicella sibirica]
MKQGTTARLGREEVGLAAAILRNGGLVAFPTETVYGLGANALDADAVAGIFAAKERPRWDPLIVHVADRARLDSVAHVSPEVEKLIAAFWPGPLTLLLPRTSAIPDAVTAGRDLVGVRMPAHPIALDLIRQSGVPIAAPSANRFGHTSPTTAAHVLVDLDGRIDAILDGGPTSVGVESTVLDVGARMIYRPGAVTAEQISSVLGAEVSLVGDVFAHEPESLPSPGVGMRHYAPRARLVLVEGTISDGIITRLETTVDGFEAQVGVMLPTGWRSGASMFVYPWGDWENGEELARRVFAGLRALDEAGATVIVCPVPDATGIGAALRDRLGKASRTD